MSLATISGPAARTKGRIRWRALVRIIGSQHEAIWGMDMWAGNLVSIRLLEAEKK
jgi:hypothetical protein